MGEQAPKRPDLKIVGGTDTKNTLNTESPETRVETNTSPEFYDEIENKYLLRREDAIKLISQSTESKNCEVEQMWIPKEFSKTSQQVGSDNDFGYVPGNRLRKKIYRDKDGKVVKEEFFITQKRKIKKIIEVDVPDSPEQDKKKKKIKDKKKNNVEKKKKIIEYTEEKEIQISVDVAKAEFSSIWDELYSNPEIEKIKKKRYFIERIFQGKKILVELDVFEGTELTVAEIEFNEGNTEQRLEAASLFPYDEFFKHFAIKTLLISGKKRIAKFKNRNLARDNIFLTRGYLDSKEYRRLVEKTMASITTNVENK